MALLIDTDLLIDAERGVGNDDAERLMGKEDRAISVITVSELLHGAVRADGARRTRRLAFVEHLLAGIEALPVTETVARIHAGVWASLAGGGRVIGAHDLWIAATALTHGMGVATRNAADFERIPGLRVVAVG